LQTEQQNKRVLIITYYWPPAGGGGVQRWLKFVKYLPEYGYHPVVYIPENAEYPVTDESLNHEVPDKLEIISHPIWEPYHLFKKITGRGKTEKVNTGLLFDNREQSPAEKLSLWLRGNLLIPDPRVFWVRPSVKYLSRYLKKNHIDVIVTTGPPHSMHLIGNKLKRKTGIKWIADFRDPWTTIDYYESFKPSRVARNIQENLEKKVLRDADRVITVSPSWAEDLNKIRQSCVDVITNGFDEDDFTKPEKEKSSDKFIITYAGFLNSLRNPATLWDCLEEMCSENEEFGEKLEFRFCGTIDLAVKSYISKLKFLSEKVRYSGYINHSELIKKYYLSDCLLLILNRSKIAKGHIPGKLFEYMASGSPVLALGPVDSDVHTIISETGTGEICEWDDKTCIKKNLIELISKSKLRQTEASKYSRKQLTKKLAALL